MRPARREVKVVPRMSTVLNFLDKGARNSLATNNRLMQNFRGLVLRLSKGQPQNPRRMAGIALVAAREVLPAATHKMPEMELQRRIFLAAKKGNWHLSRPSIVRIDKHNFPLPALAMRRNHNILLGSGARAQIEFVPGDRIFPFANFGPVFRIKMVPKNVNQEVRKILHDVRGVDMVTDVRDSIGYFGFTITHDDRAGRLIGMVLNRQERMLQNLPRDVQKAFRHWDLELLKIVEQECWRAGIEEQTSRFALSIFNKSKNPNFLVKRLG